VNGGGGVSIFVALCKNGLHKNRNKHKKIIEEKKNFQKLKKYVYYKDCVKNHISCILNCS
jgi:hypothetical protein